ncbi:MAG: glycoside hydrolase family 88 protein [Rhizobacter sp.]|nr:glycoside hydrolase family 88 protein [Ferruginibacter sp.]
MWKLRFALLSFISIGILSNCAAQKNIKKYLRNDAVSFVDSNLNHAYRQYLFFSQNIPDSVFPRSLSKEGNLVPGNSGWWCSGFYPGTLLLLQENFKNDTLKQETKEKLKILEKEKFNTSTHDLGFMMYCSFGNLNRITPDTMFKNTLVQSARSLSTRFSPVTNCIRSWDSENKKEFIVIIDNMMNLELLFYATKATGDSSYYKTAVTHANTTMRHYFRPDHSSYHLVVYDSKTGEIITKKTAQGAHDTSAWARGQAWGLYGYTVMYRETKDKKYLDLANSIADFLLHHPNLPADKIAYWDFNAPGIPEAPRDASTGSLMAAALLELATYNKAYEAKEYTQAATIILSSLSSSQYRSAIGENKGFLIKHGVGHLPSKSEVDVPLTYGDYYYVEALMRYKKLAQGKNLFE